MEKSDKVIKLKFTKGLLHLPNTQFIDKKYYQTKNKPRRSGVKDIVSTAYSLIVTRCIVKL